MNARYITMTDPTHVADVLHMMASLYREDHSENEPDPRRFPETIRTFLAHPEWGRIQLIFNDNQLVGYALLIPYWSNEYGGIILFVDELYVIPTARSQGIGRGFFAFIEQHRPFDAVAIFLEVSPANQRARNLYESLGLRERATATLVRRLAPRQAVPLPAVTDRKSD